MVPYMQKGSDAARAVHVGANLAGIGLFAWQVATGLHILFMVLELTKWP
jgi:isopentenyl diphosphate isomerase/L-lactate dehydrogenase-like FMN-dependent dehydrogenase